MVSTGGLSTFLHIDRVAERIKAKAPDCKSVVALPTVGYFLDHDNYKHTTGGAANTNQWSNITDGAANYTTWIQYIYHMQVVY
jgi:hypothetical protein